jgi:HEAT repeat protein
LPRGSASPGVSSSFSGSLPAEVVQALAEYGPAAEPVALRLLHERHLQTRRFACQLLADVGGEAALPRLRELALDPDLQLSHAPSRGHPHDRASAGPAW